MAETRKMREDKEEKLKRAAEKIEAIRAELLKDPEITLSDLWAKEAISLRESAEESTEPCRKQDIEEKTGTGALCSDTGTFHAHVETPREAAEHLCVLAPKRDVVKISKEQMQQEAVRRIILRLFCVRAERKGRSTT